MANSKHLVQGYAGFEVVVGLTAISGLVFAAGGTLIFSVVQGANELSFAQLMALGAVLGGMPTAVTLWVIRVLYDLRGKVAKLDGTPERVRRLEERLDEHVRMEIVR